jgi:PAS domain S-box-containing protein
VRILNAPEDSSRGPLNDEFRRVVDAIPGLVWTARPDGEVDFVNQRWSDYTGLSLDEAFGWKWQAAIYPEDLPRLLETWRSLLAAGTPGEMEARLQRLDGSYRWFLVRVVPVFDDAGQPRRGPADRGTGTHDRPAPCRT